MEKTERLPARCLAHRTPAVATAIFAALMVAMGPWLPERGERFYAAVPLVALVICVLRRPAGKSARLLLLAVGTVVGIVAAATVLDAGAGRPHGLAEGATLAWFLAGVLVVFAVARRVCWLAAEALYPRLTGRSPAPQWWQLAQTLLFFALFLPYLLATTNVHRPRRPNTCTPAALELGYEDVSLVTGDGRRLPAWFVPAARSDTAVLVCHGLGSNRGDVLPGVRFLHDAGFHLLLFDLRSQGDSPGHTVTYGYREARDVVAAARYLAGRPGVRHVLGYGFSMGGASLLQAVPDLRQVAGFVTDSAFADFSQVAGHYLRPLLGGLAPLCVAAAQPFFWLDAGVTPTQIRPVEQVGAIGPRPALFIHGKADALIPFEQSVALYRAAAQPKELWLVEGAGHVEAMDACPAEYEMRVTHFFHSCVPQEEKRGRITQRVGGSR